MRLADLKKRYSLPYERLWKLFSLFSLFSLGALKTGDPNYLLFLGFLLYLVVPASGRRRNA